MSVQFSSVTLLRTLLNGTVSDLRSRGRRFDSRVGRYQMVTNYLDR